MAARDQLSFFFVDEVEKAKLAVMIYRQKRKTHTELVVFQKKKRVEFDV